MPDPDYRYTLANERTFLSWLRTALALVAGGLAAAKALTFDSEVSRWVVALPPIVGGVALAAHALKRRGGYEAAMRDGTPLRAGQNLGLIVGGICAYGLVALVAIVLDG